MRQSYNNSGSRCSVKCLLPCIYKLCDGFLAAVNKAYKMFDDEEQLQYCMGVAEKAKELLDQKLEDKRKQAKKEGKTSIEEDDPIKVGCLCKIEYFTTHSLYWSGILDVTQPEGLSTLGTI